MIAGLVLAAGAGRRFGDAPKQLAELDGRPLLEHALRAMSGVPALERVVVVLGAHADAVCARVDLHGAMPVVCADWDAGQAASLRCGLGAVAEADAVVITLGDQPRITAQVIARFADLALEHGARAAARATYGGVPGHPVVLGRDHFPAVGELRGDAGARDLLTQIGAVPVECGRLASAADVDTPAQLETLRARGPD